MIRYSKQILILMIINLIIAFLLIFIGHNAREIELSNKRIAKQINQIKDEININKIEYTFHTNAKYLKKIYQIYSSSIEDNEDSTILSFKEFSKRDNKSIFLIDYR